MKQRDHIEIRHYETRDHIEIRHYETKGSH